MNVYKVTCRVRGNVWTTDLHYLVETIRDALEAATPQTSENGEIESITIVLRNVLAPERPRAPPADGGPYR